MARNNGVHFNLSFLWLTLLCSFAFNQVPITAQVSCEDAVAVRINGTKFLGTWYAAARKPIGGIVNDQQCVEMVIDYDESKDSVSVQFTFNVDPSNLWINQTTTAIVTYNSSTGNDPEIFYGIFFIDDGEITTAYKVLQTDYESYSFMCAYEVEPKLDTTTAASTNKPDSTPSSTVTETPTVTESSTNPPSTVSTTTGPIKSAGAFILTRTRQIDSSNLAVLTTAAAYRFSDFEGISTVTQSSRCYENSAGTTVPMLALIVAIVCALLKVFH